MSWIALLLAGISPALTHAPPGARLASEPVTDAYSLDEILAAIRTVETGGEPDGGRNALGDGGLALGPYQIHRAHWLDTRLPGRHEDCRDPLYARHEVLTYWARWCPTALARRDAETLARVHNGGPRGLGKASTLAYWEKTKARLEDARSRHGLSLPATTHSSEPRSVLSAMHVEARRPYAVPLFPPIGKIRRNSVQ